MKEKKVIDLGDLNEKSLQGDIPFLENEIGGKESDNGESVEFPPFDFLGDKLGEDKPPFMVEGITETSSPDNAEPVVNDKISSLEEKLEQLDTTIATVRKLDEETEEKINRIEKSLEEMLHLYELVTNDINPFVEMTKNEKGNGGREKAETSVVNNDAVKASQRELHLSRINNEPGSLMLMLKWLEFLLKKAGYVGMIKALLYYEGLGWISEKVRSRLIKYAEDIKARGGGYGKRPLSVKDHMVSLFFISKLQGLKITPMVYASVVEELQELGLQD
jgi:flagellar protein FlaD